MRRWKAAYPLKCLPHRFPHMIVCWKSLYEIGDW
jgi:hypothetical protein